ncbi:MAG: ribonuclease HI, partial [Elusimicrobia bacterium]|nr:ribonuclease HI [Elusimicrobiota bacterium]
MISIFTDGACSGNPGPGGWGAIIALPDGKVLELGGREEPTTNNRM